MSTIPPTPPPTDRQIAAVTRAVASEQLTDAQRTLLVELLDALGSALKVTTTMTDPDEIAGALEPTRSLFAELLDAVSPS